MVLTPNTTPLRIQAYPYWIDEVMPSPDPEEMTPFDLSAITPGSIKRVLMKRSSNQSSPGDDGISYIPSPQKDAIHSPLPSNSLLKDPP